MADMFESVSNIFGMLFNYLEIIAGYFRIVARSINYLLSCITFMPLYMKAALMVFLAVAIVLMVLNRGA